eukprot:gb/GEZJ01000438.1/.p1 GENE.gb/GEZJ01000438.1/~~gb/GEZJ01000438.1/.p1  ORF type:complete len:126 (+),score=5.19 gb/GEZJ01000438.1/:437-814(+)
MKSPCNAFCGGFIMAPLRGYILIFWPRNNPWKVSKEVGGKAGENLFGVWAPLAGVSSRKGRISIVAEMASDGRSDLVWCNAARQSSHEDADLPLKRIIQRAEPRYMRTTDSEYNSEAQLHDKRGV